MPYSVKSVVLGTPQELRALAARLQDRSPSDQAILTLTANSDPSAKDRGLLAAFRAALETAAEPPPPNTGNAWGDWPHDLFSALAGHVPAFRGLGAVLLAGPGGACELFELDTPVPAVGYYLTQPVTYPLLVAAATLDPVLAVELHRTHAVVRTFMGLHPVSDFSVAGPDEPRSGKSGAEGQEHADRHARELEARWLKELARTVAPHSQAVRSFVLIGERALCEPFKELLPAVAVGALEWDPGRAPRDLALAISCAADAAETKSQAQRIARLLENGPVADWQTAILAAREGRIHEVWVDPRSAMHRYLCNRCDSLLEGFAPCTGCGASPHDRLPVPELLVRAARETGTLVHFATGEAADLLSKRTGLAGSWRY